MGSGRGVVIYVLLGLVAAALVIAYWIWMGKVRYEYIQDLARHASKAQRSPVEKWEAPRIIRGPYDWSHRGDFDE